MNPLQHASARTGMRLLTAEEIATVSGGDGPQVGRLHDIANQIGSTSNSLISDTQGKSNVSASVDALNLSTQLTYAYDLMTNTTTAWIILHGTPEQNGVTTDDFGNKSATFSDGTSVYLNQSTNTIEIATNGQHLSESFTPIYNPDHDGVMLGIQPLMLGISVGPMTLVSDNQPKEVTTLLGQGDSTAVTVAVQTQSGITTTTYFDDGGFTQDTPTGTHIVVNQDGSEVKTFSDGSSETTDAYGNVVSTTPPHNENDDDGSGGGGSGGGGTYAGDEDRDSLFNDGMDVA